MNKSFSLMYDLEKFLERLCEIKQVNAINLDSFSYELKEKPEGGNGE